MPNDEKKEKEVIPEEMEFGDSLVKIGILLKDELQKVLDQKKESGGELWELMVNMGFTTEDVMKFFLSKLYNIPCVDVEELPEIPKEIIDKVPVKIARAKNILPLKKEEGVLTVACPNPFDLNLMDDLQCVTGLRVKLIRGVSSQLKAAVDKYYEAGENEGEGGGSGANWWS